MKNIWKLLMIALLALTMIGCPPATNDDDDDDNGGMPVMSWWENDDVTQPGTPKAVSNFPYGFKFTTKAGWSAQFVASTHAQKGSKNFDKITLSASNSTAKFNGPYNTMKATGALYDAFEDDSTKMWIDEDNTIPGKIYTLTFTPATLSAVDTLPTTEQESTVVFAQDDNATATTDVYNDADDADSIYISGGKAGGAWAGESNGGNAQKLTKKTDGSYVFAYEAPVKTVNVTLKITLKDGSVIKIKNVPAKQDGSTSVDGSVFGWAISDQTEKNAYYATEANVIKCHQGETIIASGLYELEAKTANPDWALNNFLTNKGDPTLASFKAEGANDVLQLSISGKEAFVPYIKGQEKIFSWNHAITKQNRDSSPAAKVAAIANIDDAAVNTDFTLTAVVTDPTTDNPQLTYAWYEVVPKLNDKGETYYDNSGDALSTAKVLTTKKAEAGEYFYRFAVTNTANVKPSKAPTTTTSNVVKVTVTGGSAPTTYTITVDSEITGGTVSVNPTTAAKDATITVTATATDAETNEVKTVTYKVGEGEPQSITPVEGVYSFTMPEGNVTVSATFGPKE